MQSELRKARASSDGAHRIKELSSRAQGEGETEILQMLLAEESSNAPEITLPERNHGGAVEENAVSSVPIDPSNMRMGVADEMASPPSQTRISPRPRVEINPGREPFNNPLALLADASGVAQALHHKTTPSTASPASSAESARSHQSFSYSSGCWLARQLLSRPGYVSLGLQTSRKSLEQGLEAVFTPPTELEYRHLNYFKSSGSDPARDVGPDLDPVDLGLVTMEEVYYLFPIYFARLHPLNGILDPLLHTPDFVRSRPALLFTWILALTSQFDDSSSGSLAKRLRLHGEKLSNHVHTCGYKSVEIVQGYYISLLSATPAKTIAEERLWLYTNYAFGIAAELGLDQRARLRNSGNSSSQALTRISSPLPAASGDDQPVNEQYALHDPSHVTAQRLARNRERTWLRILLWERANSAARGRMTTFPETELTQNIESWWLHPLSDLTDRFTCAFILLRRQLAALHIDLRTQAALPHHSSPNWVLEQVNSTLQSWSQTWISPLPDTSMVSSPEADISNIYLYYVYIHGRLWTLCYALYYISKNTGNVDDLNAIREDCFEAAVKACEIAVRDLQTIGEPLYCMLAPTWAMISYAAVLALQLFPFLYGTRLGYEVELLSLLGQVALQLQKAGSTPSHRFGIAAVLGQHLMIILRTRAAGLRDSVCNPENSDEIGTQNQQQQQQQQQQPEQDDNGLLTPDLLTYDHLLTGFDPFLTTPPNISDMECNGEAFADIFRELFGQGFGGVF